MQVAGASTMYADAETNPGVPQALQGSLSSYGGPISFPPHCRGPMCIGELLTENSANWSRLCPVWLAQACGAGSCGAEATAGSNIMDRPYANDCIARRLDHALGRICCRC
jgi:hypothetical protein